MDALQRTLIKKHLKAKLNDLINRSQSREVTVENCADENEYASRLCEQKLNLALHQRETRLIRETEETLERVDSYDFGICQECGNPIGFARIKAKPTTQYCVCCQSKFEEESSLGLVC